MSAHISEFRISNLRKMAEAVTRWPSRNVTAEDLGLQVFCESSEAAQVERAISTLGVGTHKSPGATGTGERVRGGTEGGATSTDVRPYQSDEEDGPDPFDAAYEREMELERGGIEPFQANEGDDDERTGR